MSLPPESISPAAATLQNVLAAARIVDADRDERRIPLRPTPPATVDRRTVFEDSGGSYSVRAVNRPTITPYLPDPAVATGAAMIVAPGGGFYMLSVRSEGSDVAQWLCERGVAAFVLEYRLREAGRTQAEFAERFVRALAAMRDSGPPEEAATEAADDVARALEMVRERASEWGVDPDRVGVTGFSAGAYAATAALCATGRRRRPDALACIYGGRIGTGELLDPLPPLFTAVGAEDPFCAADVLALVQAWHARRAPVEAHTYQSSHHGFGMGRTGGPIDDWIDRYAEWLTCLGWTVGPGTSTV